MEKYIKNLSEKVNIESKSVGGRQEGVRGMSGESRRGRVKA